MNTKQQQRNSFFVLAIFGLIYFGIFLIPNSLGAGNDEILLDSSSDEYVTYPNVLRILTPGKTLYETRANLFLYEDYHYGYPFYAFSALALLPIRLIYGLEFTQQMQLNMLVLRQVISVLPMLLTAGLLVFLQTRFLSTLKSLALFIFLLSIRGVVRNHIWWWHPDALAVLFIVLTIFFLDRDKMRFGGNFYFAAGACGMATAIKLLGIFFFLTIPVVVLVGLIKREITFAKAAASLILFLLVMASVVIFSNPFLFSKEQRARMIEIQVQKSEELSKGYEHDDPLYYSKGPQWWSPTLEKWYSPPLFLLFLSISLLAGCLWGGNRFISLLILTWVVPYSIYLLYFVAVKPDHYWLPVMLPLFSCAFTGINLLSSSIKLTASTHSPRLIFLERMGVLLIAIVLVLQFTFHLFRPVSGNVSIYRTALERGAAQLILLKDS